MQIIKCENYEEMSQIASNFLIDKIKHHPKSVLGLATGSTPLRIYEKLIESYEQKEISFKDVITFNLDEYMGIDCNHPQSYYQYMFKHLFSKIDIKQENIHIPKNNKNIIHNIYEYNQLLDKHQIDIQILGIGSNGHIGFNEPYSSFNNKTFIVDLDEQTRKDNQRFFNHIDEVPKQAITMGIKSIMKSKQILLLASGKNKAHAIKRLIDGQVNEFFPASILKLHDNVIVIVDKEALSLL